MTMKSLTAYALALMAFIGTISCGPSYTKPVEASQTGFAISFFKNVNEVTPKDENVVVCFYNQPSKGLLKAYPFSEPNSYRCQSPKASKQA